LTPFAVAFALAVPPAPVAVTEHVNFVLSLTVMSLT